MIETAKPLPVRCERLPDRRELLIAFTTAAGSRYTAACSYFDEGGLAEVVLSAQKFGTTAPLGTVACSPTNQPTLGAEPVSRRRRVPDQGDIAASALADLPPLSCVTSDSQAEVRECSR